ncbi:MAG: Low conductance mechanosensitive channel YnaI [Verrucomicrobiales bacterium]|nr:Low conductance mechanosensitive channel YnaI [Verrucomicrobiales bacterium]
MRLWNFLWKALLVSLALLVLWPWFVDAQTTNATNTTETVTQGGTAVVAAGGHEAVRLTFWLDQITPLRQLLFGFPLWEYIAIAIYAAIAFLVARILDYLIGVRLQSWAAKTTTKVDDWILRLLHGPLKLIVFIIFLHIGLEVFHWPTWIAVWLKKGLYVIIAFSITYMVLRVVDLLISHWRVRAATKEDTTFNEQLFPIVSRSLKTFVILVAVLVTADNLQINIRSAIAGLSIGGLALGLAAQDTVANLFGAVAVFMDKPFKLGDAVRVESFEGNVEAIGLRSTRIRNPDGHLITVPNKTMGNAVVTNLTRRPNFRTMMNIGITYDTSSAKLEEAVAILNDVLAKEALTHDRIVSFNRFADSSLNIQVLHWMKTTDYKEYMRVLHVMNMAIKQRFDAAGIGFAFPTQTVYLKQDSEWRFALPDQRKL